MLAELKRWHGVVGFRFDALAAKLLCEQYGVDLDGMDKIPKEEYVAAWVYNAHKSYCMHKYRRPKYDFKGMKKFLAGMRKQEWDGEILPAMYASRGPEGEAQKKKLPGNS